MSTTGLQPRRTEPVLGAPIDVISWQQTLERIAVWSRARDSRYICICNVHSVVTARQDPAFARVIAEADMATPDGAPVAWMLRRLGHRQQERINGPDLMLRLCDEAARRGEAIALCGSTPETLALLRPRLLQRFPRLKIADAVSPPFRPLSADEDKALVDRLNASGATVLFVSLGCPKQEAWMAAHRGQVRAVMVGVGAAFDFHAGTVARAPQWMRDNGLEWLHRLLSEPRRLWRRYLTTNARFIWEAVRQLARHRSSTPG